MQLIKVNESAAARRRIPFVLVDDTDGKTPEVGITFSGAEIKVSKNGADEVSFAGTVTEVAPSGGGVYYYLPDATEIDTVGFLSVRVTKTGVRTFNSVCEVVSFDPYDSVALGLSRIDAAITTRLASGNVTLGGYAAGQDPATLLLENPSNKLETDAGGRVNIGLILDDATAATLLRLALRTETEITATGGSQDVPLSRTNITCDLTGVSNDAYNGRRVIFEHDTATTALRRQASRIADTTGGVSGVLSVDILTNAPVSGDKLVIV